MSLGVVIKGAEGVVLAADSRITLEARQGNKPPIVTNFDNASKLLSFSKPNEFIGAVTYGDAVIGLRTAHSYIPEFELSLRPKQPTKNIPEEGKQLGVLEFAQKMSEFFMERWKEVLPTTDYKGQGMAFIVGGYDVKDAYGKVFLFNIPRQPDPEPRNPGEGEFGMTWGGQLQIASRLIHGYDPDLLGILRETLNLEKKKVEELKEALQPRLGFKIPYQVLPLQDCVDLATFLIRTTMTAQNLSVGIRGVGGPIEVAIITRTKSLEYVQQKKIHGEAGYILDTYKKVSE